MELPERAENGLRLEEQPNVGREGARQLYWLDLPERAENGLRLEEQPNGGREGASWLW